VYKVCHKNLLYRFFLLIILNNGTLRYLGRKIILGNLHGHNNTTKISLGNKATEGTPMEIFLFPYLINFTHSIQNIPHKFHNPTFLCK